VTLIIVAGLLIEGKDPAEWQRENVVKKTRYRELVTSTAQAQSSSIDGR
jgi:hypothetical protein